MFAAVTPYQLHVKLGHFNSLVWVDGPRDRRARARRGRQRLRRPHRGSLGRRPAARDRRRRTRAASRRSRARSSSTRRSRCSTAAAAAEAARELSALVRARRRAARHGAAAARLPLRASTRIARRSFTVFEQSEPEFGHLHAWGTTAQGVYRAGDTMDWKVYVRDQSNETLVAAPAGPYTLEIIDPTGQVVHTVGRRDAVEVRRVERHVRDSAVRRRRLVSVSADRRSSARRRTRRAVGSVRDRARAAARARQRFHAVAVRRATELNGDLFAAGDDVTSRRARRCSRAARTSTPRRASRRSSSRKPFRSEHPRGRGFQFDNGRAAGLDRRVAAATRSTRKARRGTRSVPDGPRATGRARHVQRRRRRARRSRQVRCRRGERRLRRRRSARRLAQHGVGVPRGRARDRALPRRRRPRRAGAPARTCTFASSGSRPRPRACAARAPRISRSSSTSGSRPASAPAVDRARRSIARSRRARPAAIGSRRRFATRAAARTRRVLNTWVVGKGQIVWRGGNDDALEIVPEQDELRDRRHGALSPEESVSRRARARDDRALRDARSNGCRRSTAARPIIEFEVEKDFMPGFYLSVLVMSPRVATPPPELGELDLGKPAFKLGYLAVPVADPYKQIRVDVTGQARRLQARRHGARARAGAAARARDARADRDRRGGARRGRARPHSRRHGVLRSVCGLLHAGRPRRPQLQPAHAARRPAEDRSEGREPRRRRRRGVQHALACSST